MVFEDIVSRISGHARELPAKDAVLFVRDQGREQVTERLSFAELDRRARATAGWLRARCAEGDRVLLLFPSGLDFVTALIGCLYAGVVAVQAPAPNNQNRQGARTAGIAADADVRLVLTDSRHLATVSEFLAAPGLDQIPCVATDIEDLGDGADWTPPRADPDAEAILQYTSGSTSDPKGVVVTHGSLMHNLGLIQRSLGPHRDTVACSWLPPYHDMGLIGMLFSPLFLGCTVILLSPTDFLRRPHRWLDLVGRYRVTFTTAPNFAYDLCTRLVTDEQLAGLDLSSLRHALNGSEPVHAATLTRFAERFAPAGFRLEVFKPCYGMAETTLFVSGTPLDRSPVLTAVDRAGLERNVFTPAPADPDAALLVSSGRVLDLDVRIVDQDTRQVLPDGRVGEVWVRGASVAAGYWRNEEATEATFRAVTADGEPGFLRTGDLAVRHDGELYVTGRLKDMLVIRGRNLYPHDIERDVAGMHEAFRGLHGSVCSVPAALEEIVVMQELRPRGGDALDLPALAGRVRGELGERLGVRVANLVFLRPGQVLRTTSGKVRRSVMRELFMTGALTPVYEDLSADISRRYRGASA
ncbi:fatty acyl-AMP ligase [Solihabitans fulvus]|uniref:fatty acyl-AMP ligase n=1 Tax=Solihabitans fulvus TaxID=1892852 RepID=UPI001661F419|nr:fatty acyl-AMP ligase [Solihabitans fulvus]